MPKYFVESHIENGEMVSSTGLSFQDFASTQTSEHKLFNQRSSSPPSWAINLNELRPLLARYMELRAGMKYPRLASPENRTVHAQRKILATMPSKIATIGKLSKEYVELKNTDSDPVRVKELARQIRTLDCGICVDSRGPALICGIIHYFFRVGYKSNETSAALKNIISPVGVRQIASRLAKLHKRIAEGRDNLPKKEEIRRARAAAFYQEFKLIQLEREKAKRAAETPEQRAARLKYARDYYCAHRAQIAARQKTNYKRRAKTRERYYSMTPEQISERKRKVLEYTRARREELNAGQRRRYALRKTKMTEQDRLIQNAYQRAYCAEHKEQRRVIAAKCKAKKKALAEGRIENRQGVC